MGGTDKVGEEAALICNWLKAERRKD